MYDIKVGDILYEYSGSSINAYAVTRVYPKSYILDGWIKIDKDTLSCPTHYFFKPDTDELNALRHKILLEDIRVSTLEVLDNLDTLNKIKECLDLVAHNDILNLDTQAIEYELDDLGNSVKEFKEYLKSKINL